MSTIPVARPVPSRLARTSSGWKLELLRWTPVDRDVFSPTTTVVHGEESCLRELSDCVDDPAVVRDAERLLGSNVAVGSSYELSEGRWMPVNPRPTRPPASRSLREISRIEEELSSLRVRVSELERLLHHQESSSHEDENNHDES